jgi:two-component system sensor histidine kinase FlrB
VTEIQLPEHQELREEFQLFRDAAEALESAYQDLKGRAAQVDLDLADANRALQSSLQDRERMLSELPIGVFRIESRHLLPQNPAACEISRCIAEEQLRSRLNELPRDTWTELAFRTVTEGANTELRQLRARRVELEEAGETLWFVEDETTVRELHDQVERLRRLSSLSELSLGVAHEVLNPLNGVAGFASLLRRNPESPKAAQWAGNIETGVVRIHRIVRDLLDFARPERRSDPVERTLLEWLNEAALGWADDEGLKLQIEDPETRVHGSPEALGKVFANLIRNACQAGASQVQVTVSSDGGRQRILLHDDGPGIPEDLADRIFDPFCSTKDDGTGLGLAFCARALEAMGGSIRLKPTVTGACFELELEEVAP